MTTLALDTTTRAGSVAIVDGDRTVAEAPGDAARTHAERLPAEVVTLLAAHDLAIGDIDLFAVAAGPGSFTGLRVGIAAMQGFALVGRRPLVGISALDALAHAASSGLDAGVRVAAWMDAHRREVFTALYEVSAGPPFHAARLREIEGPMVGDPSETLARWRTFGVQPTTFAGDGATLYAETIGRERPQARVLAAPLLAATIGRLAMARAATGTVSGAASVQPLYVRRPDAEIARDQKKSNTTVGTE